MERNESDGAASTLIELVWMQDGRWRVFINSQDTGASYQFIWDALQCAINGSLTGKPLSNLRTVRVEAQTNVDHRLVARARASEIERRALLAALRGMDGDGI